LLVWTVEIISTEIHHQELSDVLLLAVFTKFSGVPHDRSGALVNPGMAV